MKKIEIKPEVLSKVIQFGSILLAAAGAVVGSKVESNHRAKMKNEVKEEILKELSEGKN